MTIHIRAGTRLHARYARSDAITHRLLGMPRRLKLTTAGHVVRTAARRRSGPLSVEASRPPERWSNDRQTSRSLHLPLRSQPRVRRRHRTIPQSQSVAELCYPPLVSETRRIVIKISSKNYTVKLDDGTTARFVPHEKASPIQP